jgi:hypothetical protein
MMAPTLAAAGGQDERRRQGGWRPVEALPSPADGSLRGVPQERLLDMAAAGAEIVECYRLLEKTADNVVSEVLRGQGEFFEWDHYPNGDVYDGETHCQYYYHAHPAALRRGEHGHFHTFLRAKGMPEGMVPAPLPDLAPTADDDTVLAHLVAISMDEFGYPIRLFTTNRWVTGETWYRGDDVIRMLDRFDMDLAYPSLAVNLWITAMLRLFRPLIEILIQDRDRAIGTWQRRHPDANAYEARDLEITAYADISVSRQIAALRRVLHSA